MVNFTAKTQMILIHTSAGHNDCAVRILHLYIRTIRDLKQLPVIRINEADHACLIRFIIFILVHNVLPL